MRPTGKLSNLISPLAIVLKGETLFLFETLNCKVDEAPLRDSLSSSFPLLPLPPSKNNKQGDNCLWIIQLITGRARTGRLSKSTTLHLVIAQM